MTTRTTNQQWTNKTYMSTCLMRLLHLVAMRYLWQVLKIHNIYIYIDIYIHWDLNKNANILYSTCPKAFVELKILHQFALTFVLTVQSKIRQHWLRNGLVPNGWQTIDIINDDQFLKCHMASLNHNGFSECQCGSQNLSLLGYVSDSLS